uniref:Uncharacterized protein n=1 Tax=viral metagenome TaxID=1070528 RepID=A0A6C0CF28_9ZZZZ
MNIDYTCSYINPEAESVNKMMKPCNDGKTNFQWECEQKRILDNAILARNLERPDGANIQGVLPHSQMLDNVKVVQNAVKTDLKEGFTNLGESYVEPGVCPDGYFFCPLKQKCVQVCQNCKFNEKKYYKSKEFNEGDPCFPNGVYNGIDNQGITQCTCGSKGQYCNDTFDTQGGMLSDGVYIVNVGDYFNVGDLAAY